MMVNIFSNRDRSCLYSLSILWSLGEISLKSGCDLENGITATYLTGAGQNKNPLGVIRGGRVAGPVIRTCRNRGSVFSGETLNILYPW